MNLNWIDNNIQIGDFIYTTKSSLIDFELIIQAPELWLGNLNFSDFIGDSIFRLKEPKECSSLDLLKPNLAFPSIQKSMMKEEKDTILQSLHHAVYLYLINDISVFDDNYFYNR